jgi:hypothetical protein
VLAHGATLAFPDIPEVAIKPINQLNTPPARKLRDLVKSSIAVRSANAQAIIAQRFRADRRRFVYANLCSVIGSANFDATELRFIIFNYGPTQPAMN